MSVVTQGEVQNFVCSICRRIFDNETTIIAHTLHSHQNEPHIQTLRNKISNTKRPKCSTKNIAKKKQAEGKKTIRKYATEYKCDSCSYKTPFLSTFKRHSMIHKKGSRIHECSFCSYASIQHYNLIRHIKDVHPFGGTEPIFVIRDQT